MPRPCVQTFRLRATSRPLWLLLAFVAMRLCACYVLTLCRRTLCKLPRMPRPFRCRGLVCKPFAFGRVSSERRYVSALTRSAMILACDPLRSTGVCRGCRGLGCRGLLSKRITRHGGGLRTRAVLFNCRPESTSPPRREAALGSADLGNMNPRHCPLVCCLSRHLPSRRLSFATRPYRSV